jgi:hypothetical protein
LEDILKHAHFFLLALIALLLVACGPSASPPATRTIELQDGQTSTAPADAPGAETEPTDAQAEVSSDAVRETPDLSMLPIGDGNVSTEPRVGYVWSCMQDFDESGGASATGDWFDANAGTWNSDIKPVVDGAVSWDYEFSMTVEGDTRIIRANGLPFHETGNYPVASSDDAYTYDANPHSISEQSYTLELPANPTLLSTPTCIRGEVGIAISGVVINNALDLPGRDAVSTEIQDQCQGHPHTGGIYHYHGYSLCLEDQDGTGHSDLIGWVLDGFGIYGPYGENGEVLTNEDLDECHGHTHSIDWDGEVVEMFHYHTTFEYPYTVGCFRGESVVFEDALVSDSGSDDTGTNNNDGGNTTSGQTPPQEAIDACSGLAVGDACSIGPNSGSCANLGGSLACEVEGGGGG